MGSLICCHIKANQVQSQSLTSINISVNNDVFSGKLTHKAPLPIILVKSTMVQNIGTNNFGQE